MRPFNKVCKGNYFLRISAIPVQYSCCKFQFFPLFAQNVILAIRKCTRKAFRLLMY